MTALAYPYDDATAPFRPSVDDLGGDAMIDDPDEPPGAGEPQAAAWNNKVRLHAGRERMGESVRVTVDFNAGAPFIKSAVGMRTSFIPANFTPTDNGVGDTTIAWAVTLLPPQTQDPCVFQHSLTPGCIGATAPTGITVRVVSTTHAGVADDIPFTVEIR